MNKNRILVGMLLGLLLILAIPWMQGLRGPGLAKEAGQTVASPHANMGTAFTYQGRLTNASGPVDGNCDFEFSLWDEAGSGEPPTGGTQVGATQAETGVAVSDGLFTIPDLDFGSAAFIGDARWLQIGVRCPAGSGTYATLAPRQALTPAPYALALPGLWTQQHATSPNLIGGHSGNSVTDGVWGATINGGGRDGEPNSVTDNGGTIGGGSGNTASGEFVTIGGGLNNQASHLRSTVGGGLNNQASNNQATVGGGYWNLASGSSSTIGGGNENMASSHWTTIGGGRDNKTSSIAATVGGGDDNEASGDYATIPGGTEAVASHYGEMAYASGRFASDGDAQTSVYVLRNETTNTSLTELFLDGSSERLTIAPDRAVIFDILLVAHDELGNSIGCTFQGVIKNAFGTTTFVMAPGKLCQKAGLLWDANVVANDDNDALQIEVTGGASADVGWVARVQTVEVSY